MSVYFLRAVELVFPFHNVPEEAEGRDSQKVTVVRPATNVIHTRSHGQTHTPSAEYCNEVAWWHLQCDDVL